MLWVTKAGWYICIFLSPIFFPFPSLQLHWCCHLWCLGWTKLDNKMASTISFEKEKKDHFSNLVCLFREMWRNRSSSLVLAPRRETVNKLQVLPLPKEQWPMPTVPPESPMSWLPVIQQKIPWQILNSNFLCSTSLLLSMHFNSLKRQRLALPNAKNHNGYFHHFSLLFFFPSF